MQVQLRPHQEEAVFNKLHNGCILYGDVGVGKTITSLGYYFARVCNGEINKWGSMKTPKDVYVITTATVRDKKTFEVQAAAFGVHTNPEISTNGVKITVDSWNNLHKYVEVENAFFIFDEQRVVGYGAWSRAFIKVARNNEWILLSATPGDTWLDYIPVFIANGWYKHKTDFIDQHVIWTPRVKYPKVLRYQGVNTLVRRRNDVLVHMPYDRHTVRHSEYIDCEFDQELFDKVVKKKWHVYENRPLRDAAELFSVMRKVVNSDESRISEVRRLLKKHPKVIVFYNFDYELEMLRTLIPADQMASPESVQQMAEKINRQRMDSAGESSVVAGATASGTTTTTSSSAPSTPVPVASLSTARSTPGPDTSESPSGTSKRSERTSTESSSRSSSTTPSTDSLNPPTSDPSVSESSPSSMTTMLTECSSECEGHWTTDRGMGETFLTCRQWNQAASASRERRLSGSSKDSSTSNSPTSSSTGLIATSSSGSSRPASKSSKSSDSPAQSGVEHSGEGSSISSGTLTGETSFAVAEWNGHKHEEIPATERWLYLVQYRAGAEGWNCIETDAMVFYSQTYSYRDWHQAHGRIDRLNTPFIDLFYYNLFSRSIIDKAIRRALRSKKNFNERDLVL